LLLLPKVLWPHGSKARHALVSDAELGNELNHVVHTSLGFAETERVVFSRKAVSQ
jgi:hypothetical protein